MRALVLMAALGALLGSAAPQPPAKIAESAKNGQIRRIGFGSCLHQDKKMAILERVRAAEPELFVFLGDNIYGDSTDERVLAAKYRKLGSQPEFQLLKQQARLLATWDDHDYGANDAGVEFPAKVQSKRLLLDFFEVPAEAAVRRRPGIYRSHYFGEADQRIQLILLDTRWFRTALDTGGRRFGYIPNHDPKGTLLGEAQWRWLAGELQQPAALRIIASSIQMLPSEHPFEAWGKLPAERERVLSLLKERKGGAVLIISGDRHMAEISRLGDLLEVTSSSLNRAGGGSNKEPNKLRQGRIFAKSNFGMIEIDWQKRLATTSIRDADGTIRLQQPLAIP